MRKKFRNSLLVVVCAASLSLTVAACGSSTNEDGSYAGIVPIYTPRQGGSAYILGGGIANQVSESDSLKGVQGTVEATTGTQEMLQRLDKTTKSDMPAFALPDTTGTAKAIEGAPPFEKAYPDIRALTTVQEGVIYMVTRSDSDMTSLSDLKGKSVGLGVSGSVVNYLTKEVLEAHGVSADSYDEQPLGYQEVADGLANGSVDAGVIAGADPVSTLTELAAQHDVSILEPEEQVMADLKKDAPHVLEHRTDPGTYKGMDDEISTFGFSVAVVTTKDTDDKLVRGMMEILFEETEALAKVHASAKGITPDNATKGVGFEFHPAAAEYLKEKGVELPEPAGAN